jgi:predicted transcriptional regulator of viral defense system
MKVQNDEKMEQRIQTVLQKQNGMLFTQDLVKRGIPRSYLSILEKKGKIQRIGRGVYASTSAIGDDMAALQSQYKKAIFSHETALFLLDLTDRSPLFFSVTVPSGYNATALKAHGAKVYFVKPELFSLGEITSKTPGGNDVKTYSPERTICDLIRNRNQIDVQLLHEALKRYVQRKDRDLDHLFQCARLFRIEKVLRTYIEVLL